ncbi:MAG: ABC transporter permease subunit [Anaerolineae bacterium]|jgi:multiple sugar transport system permease protein
MHKTAEARFSFFSGRQWRRWKEALTAYFFIFPAFLIVGLFGLFPIVFAVYVSVHRWRIKPGDFFGLGNYARAIDTMAYVVAFWLCVIFVALALRSLRQMWRTAREHGDRLWPWLVPAAVMAAGIAQFLRFFFLLLPQVLGVADKIRGQERTQELFLQLLGEAWGLPAVQSALRLALLLLALGLVLGFLVQRFLTRSRQGVTYYISFLTILLMVGGAALLGWFTWTEIEQAYAAALEAGESLDLWAQIVTMSAGLVLLILAWLVWRRAEQHDSTIGMLLRLGGAAILLIGAWILIGELPRVIAAGDDDWWQGLKVTAYYSIGTVPFQLGISLLLATLLFQNIRGKGFFRLLYFLPYITPAVAAAGVFRVFFSSRPTAPINSLLNLFNAGPLLWLDEPKGILQMIAGSGVTVPEWAAGPSLALVVVIIYNIWSYVGYDTVIFLAGLGSIPSELYEAAAIDGAGRFAQFRHITFPLLSPTTYFLTLLAVIGTFKAFNHVWVLRSGAALGTTDTASIVIFNEFNRNTRYGYAASLALLLLGVIMILTIVNNRIAEERVFYG